MQRSSQYDWVDVKILNLSEMLIEQSFNTVQHNLLLLGFQPLTAWAPMADPKLGECTRWSTPTARYIIVRYNFLETFQKSFWFLLFDSNQIQLWKLCCKLIKIHQTWFLYFRYLQFWVCVVGRAFPQPTNLKCAQTVPSRSHVTLHRSPQGHKWHS